MSSSRRRIAVAAGLTVGLVVADISSSAVARFGVDHPLAASVMTGVLSILLAVLVVDEVIKRRDNRKAARTAALLLDTLVRDLISTFSLWRSARKHAGDESEIQALGAPQAVGDLRRLVVDLIPILGTRDDTREVVEKVQALTRWMSQGLSVWYRFPANQDFVYTDREVFRDDRDELREQQILVQSGESDFLPHQYWGVQAAQRLIDVLAAIHEAVIVLDETSRMDLVIERCLLDSLLIVDRADALNADKWLMP